MELKTHSQKGKPKIIPFDTICKQEFQNMLQGFKQIDWPARQDEVKQYIFRLQTLIKGKHFNKENAKTFLNEIKGFLYLYKTITGGDLKLTRLPGEKLLHDGVKKLTKEIHRKVLFKQTKKDDVMKLNLGWKGKQKWT